VDDGAMEFKAAAGRAQRRCRAGPAWLSACASKA
jgi:hypothetical protein